MSRAVRAASRGVFAVRRSISPESYGLFEAAGEALIKEIHGRHNERLFDPRTLTVTVVGLHHFSEDYIFGGVPTKELIKNIPSSNSIIDATLGTISLFGFGRSMKLAFGLMSERLVEEHNRIRELIVHQGYSLQYPRGWSEYQPHCSVAPIREDPETHAHRLSRYNRVLIGIIGQTVRMSPVLIPERK